MLVNQVIHFITKRNLYLTSISENCSPSPNISLKLLLTNGVSSFMFQRSSKLLNPWIKYIKIKTTTMFSFLTSIFSAINTNQVVVALGSYEEYFIQMIALLLMYVHVNIICFQLHYCDNIGAWYIPVMLLCCIAYLMVWVCLWLLVFPGRVGDATGIK